MKRPIKILAKLCLGGLIALNSALAAMGQEEEFLLETGWEDELAGHVAELEASLISFHEAPIQADSPTQSLEHGGGCGCSACCPGWFFSADYLNWQVERDDVGFAIFDPTALGVPTAGTQVMSLDLGNESGLRIAGGRRTRSGWELGAAYTYLSSSDRQSFAPGGGRVLAVQSSPATGLVRSDSVTANSEFDYNVFDVEAGHWFHPSDSVSAMLLGGVRFATIDHLMQAAYSGGDFTNGSADVSTEIDAFGGRFGGAIHWNAADQFSLFAKTSLSVLKGDVDARRRELNGGATVLHAIRPADQMLTAIDVSVGLRYYLDGWSIAAGYEWTNWFNAVSPLEFSDNFHGGTVGPPARDLGLHGFFANAAYAW